MNKFLIEQINGHKFGHEEQLAIAYCKEKSIPYKTATLRQVRRKVSEEDLVNYTPVGTIDFVFAVLTRLWLERPNCRSYPLCLGAAEYGRRIPIVRTLATVFDKEYPVFVKPVEVKRFKGLVINGPEGIPTTQPWGEKRELWVSPVINIEHEYRVYITDKKISFFGDSEIEPDLDFVESIVDKMTRSGHSTFTLDIGVSNGRHIVVECNDAFAVGLYNPKEIGKYLEMLDARFADMLIENNPL